MKILLPWKMKYSNKYTREVYKSEILIAYIEKETQAFRVRRVDTKTPPKEIRWLYKVYDVDSAKMMYGFRMDEPIYMGEESSKEAAMKIVDGFLEKSGYKLLKEGDKLLSLI